MLVAAIDIGSNAARLLIASFYIKKPNQKYKVVQYLRVPIRLGDYVFIHQKIPKEKEIILLKTMQSFALLMELYRVKDYRACATSALREAKNGKNIIKKIKKQSNLNLEIIDGSEEANLIFKAHQDKIETKEKVLFVDVGGGSTELTLLNEGKRIISKSFKIGTVRMLDNQVDEYIWEDMRTFLKEKIQKEEVNNILGSGGNINKILSLLQIKSNRFASLKDIKLIYQRLNQSSLKERVEKWGLNPDRADVIIPATEVFLDVMEYSGIKKITSAGLGLRDGLILELYEKHKK